MHAAEEGAEAGRGDGTEQDPGEAEVTQAGSLTATVKPRRGRPPKNPKNPEALPLPKRTEAPPLPKRKRVAQVCMRLFRGFFGWELEWGKGEACL